MSRVDADRNLLFGVLALQNGFIAREQLIASVSAWVLDKARPLDAILLEQGALRLEDHALLEPLVRRHLAYHGDDPTQSLAALSSATSVREALADVTDADVQASLSGAAQATEADPGATLSYAPAGRSPSSRFVILRPYAEGGLGKVSVALDRELNRRVAFKEIKSGAAADDPVNRARFVAEAEITGGLEHPGIVPVYSLGHDPRGRPYYAMRFVEGENLEHAIKRFHDPIRGPKDPGEREVAFRALLRRFLDVCNAVAFAHRKGVLHRDIKPGNVLLGEYGETLVVDWGLAKALGKPGPEADASELPVVPSRSGDSSHETLPGSALGTPAYMSPEQAAGRLDRLGPASDVYSLGATLYVLLTGRTPFEGYTGGELLRQVQKGGFPPPRSVDPRVPRPLEAICLKAMGRGPEDRYPTVRELAGEIERWLADEPVRTYREPVTGRAGRWMRRHRLLVASLVTGLITALLGAWAVVRTQGQRERQRLLVSIYRTTAETLVRLLEESTAPAGPAPPEPAADPFAGLGSGALGPAQPDPEWLEPLRRRYDEIIRRLEASGQDELAREVEASFQRINDRYRRITPFTMIGD